MTEPVVLFPDVTVVVVAYNSADVLPGCIASLASGQPLVLVDNASGDDSAAVVKRLAPWAEVIVRPVNEGFGAGANIGFARVKTEFGLLLNPDTHFDATAMIGALVAAARRYPDAGLLAPMLTEEGKGLFWGRQIFRSPPLAKPPHDVPPEGDTCSQYVGGSVMFFPMPAFQAVGGFDERVFLFYEDDDICLRLRALGYGLVHVADALLHHQAGQSTTGVTGLYYWKQWHMAWSRAYMERKWGGRCRLAAYVAQEGLTNLVKWLARPHDPRRPRYAGRLAGLVAYLVGRKARDVRLGSAQERPSQLPRL